MARNRKDMWMKRVKQRSQIIEGVAEAFFVLLLCIHPLYLDIVEKYVRLTGHKKDALYLVVILGSVALAVAWVATLEYRPARETKGFLKGMAIADWGAISYLLFTFVSAILSPFKYESGVDLFNGVSERFDGIYTQIVYVAIYFFVSRCYKFKVRDMHLFAISAICVSAIGILQFYDIAFKNIFPYDIQQQNSAGELHQPYLNLNSYTIFFRSTLGNVDIVSTYVAVSVVFCFVMYIRQSSHLRYLYLAGGALSTWLMLLAGADSGIIGTLAGMMLFLLFAFESMKAAARFFWSAAVIVLMYITYSGTYHVAVTGEKSPESLIKFIVLAVLLAAVGAAFFFAPKFIKWKATLKQSLAIGLSGIIILIIGGTVGVEIIGKDPGTAIIYEAREILHGNFNDDFATHRLYIWKQSLRVVPQSPLFGTGPDTFYHALGSEWQSEAAGKFSETYDKAHNEYVQVLVCIGIAGLLAYIAMAFGSLARCLKYYIKSDQRSNPYIAGVICAMAAYLAQAFFNINTPITGWMLWLFAGLLVQLSMPERQPVPVIAELTADNIQRRKKKTV